MELKIQCLHVSLVFLDNENDHCLSMRVSCIYYCSSVMYLLQLYMWFSVMYKRIKCRKSFWKLSAFLVYVDNYVQQCALLPNCLPRTLLKSRSYHCTLYTLGKCSSIQARKCIEEHWTVHNLTTSTDNLVDLRSYQPITNQYLDHVILTDQSESSILVTWQE